MNQSDKLTQPAAGSATRRQLLYAGVAAAAALSGAGFAWRRWSAQLAHQDAAVLWPMTFETPSGTQLAMQSLRGKPLLLNFWATWCPPCIEEMPLLNGFFRDNRSNSWQVVGLAIDQPSAVRAFLARSPVSYPVGLAGMGGSELSKELGNQLGGLPFSVVIGSGGRVLQRKIGRVTTAELDQWRGLH
jgi:thiol-disulfide isomerase/thioredoxin